jgi:hypothetical protein
MSNASKLVQQGDVLFFKVEGLPEEGLTPAKSSKRGMVVFAEGESHGHYHSVLEESGVKLFEDETGTLWCSVPAEVEVEHQEHNKVTLAPGNYRIGIVREVDPFSEEIHAVRD